MLVQRFVLAVLSHKVQIVTFLHHLLDVVGGFIYMLETLWNLTHVVILLTDFILHILVVVIVQVIPFII